MHARTHRLFALGTVSLVLLSGCASEPTDARSAIQTPDTTNEQQADPHRASEGESTNESAETSIPAGAYAASAEFPFPIPDGWEILDPFVEGKLGKDSSMDGSVEYPGDAKDAATTYLTILKDAGFNAYPYGPGELTNQASLAAEGRINDIGYTAILNFDVHADGLQRVSITAVESK